MLTQKIPREIIYCADANELRNRISCKIYQTHPLSSWGDSERPPTVMLLSFGTWPFVTPGGFDPSAYNR